MTKIIEAYLKLDKTGLENKYVVMVKGDTKCLALYTQFKKN